MKHRIFMAAAAMLATLAAPHALSQAGAWPNKPIRLIAGFPPGTPPEVVARLLADKMAPALGQPIVVENRPGASGTIAATTLTQAPADGYTISIGVAASLAVAPHFLPSAKYDPITAFTPIGFVLRGPYLLTVRADLPVNNVKELVAYAKANPGKLNFGTPGIGSVHQLNFERLKQHQGIDIVHVPFQGTPPMINETVAGRTQVFMESGGAGVASLVKSGKLRWIGITHPKRSSLHPDVPTLAEQGLPGLESEFWWGFIGPAGMPREIVTRLNAELNKALASPDIRDRFRAEGVPDELHQATTPEEFGERIATEYRRWGPIIKAAGVKVE